MKFFFAICLFFTMGLVVAYAESDGPVFDKSDTEQDLVIIDGNKTHNQQTNTEEPTQNRDNTEVALHRKWVLFFLLFVFALSMTALIVIWKKEWFFSN